MTQAFPCVPQAKVISLMRPLHIITNMVVYKELDSIHIQYKYAAKFLNKIQYTAKFLNKIQYTAKFLNKIQYTANFINKI